MKGNASKRVVIFCAIIIIIVATLAIEVNIMANKIKANNELAKVSSNFKIDNNTKEYKSFEKCKEEVGFEFKVPDYTVKGVVPKSSVEVDKIDEDNKYLDIKFDEKNKDSNFKNYSYNLNIFKGDFKEFFTNKLKKVNKGTVDITSSKKVIGDITGEEIIITCKLNEAKDYGFNIKAFGWKDNDISYSISTFHVNNPSLENADKIFELSDEEINLIVSSIKKPEDITNVKYFEVQKGEVDSKNIYNNNELNEEAKELGFTPKVIENINERVALYKTKVNKTDNNKSEIELQYFFDEINLITLNETKYSEEYDDYKNSNSNYQLSDKCKKSKFKKKYIDGQTVYKLVQDEEYNTFLYLYTWEKDGIYYNLHGRSMKNSSEEYLEDIISDILKSL